MNEPTHEETQARVLSDLGMLAALAAGVGVFAAALALCYQGGLWVHDTWLAR